jgi:hypothetical protein
MMDGAKLLLQSTMIMSESFDVLTDALTVMMLMMIGFDR